MSLFERVVGSLGVDNIDALYKIAGNDSVLKEIGDAVKKYRNDDNIVYMYDAEKAMKRAYMYDLRYEVNEAVKKAEEEITKDVTEKNKLEMAKKMKDRNYKTDEIALITGLDISVIENI